MLSLFVVLVTVIATPTPVKSVWQVQKLGCSPEAKSFTETGLLEVLGVPKHRCGPDLFL